MKKQNDVTTFSNDHHRDFGEPSSGCPKARFGAGEGLPGAEPELNSAMSPSSSTHFRSGGFAVKHEEVVKRVDGALAELEQSLANGKSETMLAFLAFLSRFHSYSFRNVILIMMQSPDASLVAGYRKWQAMNRFVKKGEKGIKILAPLVRKKADGDEKNPSDVKSEAVNDGKAEKVIFGYRAVTVFDVSQTEGEELPTIRGYSGDPAENLSKLEAFVADQGIELKWEAPGRGALGVSQEGRILVAPNLEPAESFAVLVHELAHELLHKGKRRTETTKTIRETEAEAVAFAVCSAVGIDPGDSASDYIQLHQGDVELLKASLEHIRSTASEILSALTVESSVEVQEVNS